MTGIRYPDGALIGAFPGRRQIIEFDGSSEFTGKNRIPYTQPEYFERRWRYDLSRPGVMGYNLRIDHGGYDSLHTPNEINIFAMSRFTADPKATAADIWKQWTETHYGKAAAPEIEQALKPAYDIVNLSFYVLQFWITDHSKLPTLKYSESHLHIRTMAKWMTYTGAWNLPSAAPRSGSSTPRLSSATKCWQPATRSPV
jgi:hypothetical protein